MDRARRRVLAAGLGSGLGFALSGALENDPQLGVGAAHADDLTNNLDKDLTTDARDKPIIAPLIKNTDVDQAAILQASIDTAARTRQTVLLPVGTFVISALRLRSGTRLSGGLGVTKLIIPGDADGLTGDSCQDLFLHDFTVERARTDSAPAGRFALSLNTCRNVYVDRLTVSGGDESGVLLNACDGRIDSCNIAACGDTGLKAIDSTGLAIKGNHVSQCADNGIQIWRTAPGYDGTIVSQNRISEVRNVSGGSGQYGNGINVFRADGVTVSNNVITDCAYSAVRGNAASDIQIVANTCRDIGEVAIYAEFAFTGALIASNLVDRAALGISVTNFNDGGRLAVVQGNLIRNLFLRPEEPVDKRGIGVSVEADTSVTGNTVENAPDTGIQVGWGPFMRNVAVTGNVIRNAGTGIGVSGEAPGKMCLIANNLIAESRNGAIRTMRLGTPYGPDLAGPQRRADGGADGVVATANLAS